MKSKKDGMELLVQKSQGCLRQNCADNLRKIFVVSKRLVDLFDRLASLAENENVSADDLLIELESALSQVDELRELVFMAFSALSELDSRNSRN